MDPPQVLLVASSSNETNITVWDARTGAALTSYKSNASPCNGLSLMGRDYLVAAQAKKGALHFWTWHKDQVHQRSFAPEPISALACSPGGAYCAAGGRSGAVHVWDLSSGRLLRSWPAHYKAVSCLAFSDGGAALVTGGDDTQVHAWLMVDLLDSAAGDSLAQQAQPGGGLRPLHTWSEHTLPVTSLVVGAGGLNAVVASSSLDYSIRLRSLGQGGLLRTLALPEPLHSVALDPGEYSAYAGGASGRIYRVSLVGEEGAGGGAAGGPGGAQGAVSAPGTEPTAWAALEGHTLPVTCLAFSSDGLALVSGSEDCSVRFWDVRTLQPLRTLASPAKGPVSAILLVDRPVHMQVGGSGGGGGGGGGRKGPQRSQPLAQLCKCPSAPGALRPWESALVLLDGALEAGSSSGSEDERGWGGGSAQPDGAAARGGAAVAAAPGAVGQGAEEIEALRAENKRLRAELAQAVGAAQQGLELNQKLQRLVGGSLAAGP